ncbi:Mog1p/PsbP-like protein [Setomelanomma holmii]|uniref:Mog1p/PsbP-like protein n=1 Tax=Setomelanomma holmii TaxID=210430 RepID=A0A9P4LLS6_9PLEO|nr:Mog1p/PsbP-like protein [Setomelanomma holmii]
MAFTNTPLYGGAITVHLPSAYADTSQIREVPDHQEVYLDTNGYSSVVIEILEYVHKNSNDEALQYHFADLVDGMGDSTTILKQDKVVFKELSDKPALALTFIQTPVPALPSRKTPEFVYIHLLLLRLKEQGTDVMVTVNVPHYKGEYEEAAEGQETQLMKDGGLVMEGVLQTFKVVEWGLFDG